MYVFIFIVQCFFSIKINYFLVNSLTLSFKNIWQQLVAQEHLVKSTFNLFAILQAIHLYLLGQSFSAKLQIPSNSNVLCVSANLLSL